MTPLKTRALILLGAICASFTVAVLLRPSGNSAWGVALVPATAIVFVTFGLSKTREALILTPQIIAATWGLGYFYVHTGEPLGWVAFVAALTILGLGTWVQHIRQRAT